MRDPTKTERCVLVLGMFDGVHCGHQALLREGRRLADAHRLPLHVCTFEPHPVAVLFPERTPPRLTMQAERAQLMQRFGVDALCVTSFTKAFAAMPPEQYAAQMALVYQPQFVVCGFNFTFGDRGRGNADTLRAMQAVYGYETITVPEVVQEGATVSSSRIRRLLQAGDLDTALRLLGHGYTLCGRVIRGRQIGRTLGYPTANIAVKPGKALPAHGVYACRMHIRGDDRIHHAVVSVGAHPTVPDGLVTVEAHALDESLCIYGADVRLDFLAFLRPEQTFSDLSALREQIAKDVEEARKVLGM